MVDVSNLAADAFVVAAGLAEVQLPVHFVVVLEQHERAGQGDSVAQAAREWRAGFGRSIEHVFVPYVWPRTDARPVRA
jgi:hypothetical protein